MKQKEVKKLRLGKVTIQDINTHLEEIEQKTVKGGNNENQWGTTEMIIYCVS